MKNFKQWLATLILAATSLTAAAQAQWIVPVNCPDTLSTWMCLQHHVNLPKKPSSAISRISADSRYWLWINGEQVIIDGCAKRGPNRTDSYYDEIDLAPYLHKGANLISVEVWYYGKESFSYNLSGKAAFLMDCPKVPELNSGAKWIGTVHPAYYLPQGTPSNMRLPESNIGFDARKSLTDWQYRKNNWEAVTCIGHEGDSPWGKLHPRLIPQWKDYGLRDYTQITVRKGMEQDTLIGHLPYNGQMMPYIELEAPAGCVIGIMTDNYMGGGEPNVRAEYITREGFQHYENKGWMNGEQIWYIIPKRVKVKKIQYHETGYNTEFAGSFNCSDEFYNRLWQKALRTLYVTMRDTYMDCPDRERAQWWGDEVNESGEAFYALSVSSHALMKKGMYELIGWQRSDGSLFSPIPATNWSAELPGQMLASIGYYGFWNYYLNTGDLQTIADLYPGVKRYMALWNTLPDGTIENRQGGWHWGDWGSYIDKGAIYNGFYYLALRGQRLMAQALGKNEESDAIAEQMKRLKTAFNRVYWNGNAYRDPSYTGETDDRAQALAVVSGLADEDKYPYILEIFHQVEHASPYIEKYVLEALFQMGQGEFALERMKKRFKHMVNHIGHTTLFEGWKIGDDVYGGGTANHAWSGGGLTLLSQYVCGISPIEPGYKTFRVAPQLSGLRFAEAVIPTVAGNISVHNEKTSNGILIRFNTLKGARAVMDVPSDAKEVRINGKSVWHPGDNSTLTFKPAQDWIVEIAIKEKRTVPHINLAGEWTVSLDSADIGLNQGWEGQLFSTPIELPGTTDAAGLGEECVLKPSINKPQILHLTRAHRYVGPAWYSRLIKIPSDWEGKECILQLERVLWDTQIWIDGIRVKGHEESLTTPHEFLLTPYLKPGKQQMLTLRIDNRKRYDISVNDMAHAYTDHTQVMWNGVIGEMAIKAYDKVRITNVQIYPDAASAQVKAHIQLSNTAHSSEKLALSMAINGSTDAQHYADTTMQVTASPGQTDITLLLSLGKNAPKWDEFNPYLYEANISLEGSRSKASRKVDFGLRTISRKGNRIFINDRQIFLRGTLECCIFPLTGTPPTQEADWQKVFNTAHKYGLNHLRFHSWCPPEAAFRVADRMGFYLQIELPVWSVTLGKDSTTLTFLANEGERISRTYGNHPSFCLWSMGNELQSDFNALSQLMTTLKNSDSRHLYTTSTFTFEKGHGTWPEVNDDYFITQWTRNGWVRGQGIFNQEPPCFDKDYRTSLEGMQLPLVTHEVGQYAVYPDLTEIPHYTGTLLPLNLMGIREDLEKKGLIQKSQQYLLASGKLAAILYKEEMERALKTPGISGIQMLGLQDFPGQGTAHVGLLNAFWESKGIVSDQEFREFCAPVVPLLRFPQAIYSNRDTFEAQIELSNFGTLPPQGSSLSWSVCHTNGDTIACGHLPVKELHRGLNEALGTIQVPLQSIHKASRLEVRLKVDESSYQNHWSIWVYPELGMPDYGEVVYTRDYAEALTALEAGHKVLFNPEWATTQGIEGKFVPVFWSPVHFPKQAGTMGVLCNPSHPALSLFPTEMHTDWQWWDLNIHSTTLVIDNLKGAQPIVEMIDNFANNRHLASLFEGKVGKGSLVCATFDLHTDLAHRPVARQMLESLLRYMNSDSFTPSMLEGFDQMKDIFGTTQQSKLSAQDIY